MTLNISNKDNNILSQAQSEDFSAKTIESVGYGLEINELNQPYASDNLFTPDILQPESIDNLAKEEREIVFIDSAVKDSQTLIDNISGATEVVVLDSNKDEIWQISQHLDNYQELDAIHIVSHGVVGEVSFKNTALNSHTLALLNE